MMAVKSKFVTCALLLLALSGCTFIDNPHTPKGYVHHCIRIMDKTGLYAEGKEWENAKNHALQQAKEIASLDEAHEIITEALHVCGGKHSALRPPLNESQSLKEETPQALFREDNILYLSVPAHMGISVNDTLYSFTLYDTICRHTDAKGYIIDLRGNMGGNMYPMLAGLSPLLPEGTCLEFQKKQHAMPVTTEYIRKTEIGNHRPALSESLLKRIQGLPIALLTDTLTASSGEATLLAFRGLDNTKTFGCPTAGYASANIPYPLPDGYTLVLTISQDVARTGEVFCDDPIQPDVETDTPLESALLWMKSL